MLLGVIFLMLSLRVEGVTINVRTKNRFKNITIDQNFWRNTGLCPASTPKMRSNFLLSNDEKLNLNYIGALPNEAINSIRIHWLLDLVTVEKIESNKPIFNFDYLNLLIFQLHQNGLTPIFELMGNPSNYFYDFKIQGEHWLELLKQLIKNYSDLYGVSYVKKWKFELMNEPDLKQYNFLNFTLESYLDYYRTCELAVPNLIGPAGLFKNNKKSHQLCWGLLDYCNSNFCNLRMITFHKKGEGSGSKVVAEGLSLINTLYSKFPQLQGIPFGNDEADIMTGWYKPYEWRADTRYAALVVQVIIGHVEEMLVKRNIPFELLSNDNAFLSFSPYYFTQRTLLARFQINNTNPPHVQFFKKAVYSVMGLLSLLGDNLKDIRYHPGENGFSYIMTSHKYQYTFLGVVTNDIPENQTYSINQTNIMNVNFKMSLRSSNMTGIWVGYIMNNLNTNPYQVWKNSGSPDFPNKDLRREMRKAEGFRRFIRKVKPYQTQFKFNLQNVIVPSVFAVNICYDGVDEPGPVVNLRYLNITHNEILLIWKDTKVNSRCLLTYVVEFKRVHDNKFQRINNEDSIFLSYHFDGYGDNGTNIGIVGEFRVAAVDYWNRRGPFSNVIEIFG